MSKLRFNISMSLDGYAAGPNQGLDAPPARAPREHCTTGSRGLAVQVDARQGG